jgi:transposase/transposase-like protein
MTDKSVDLVEGLIVKPATHGRRTYRVKAKRALVQMCGAPGVSVAGLALAHGINANLLRRWMSQYGQGLADSAAPRTEPRAALLPMTTTCASPPMPTNDCEASIEISFKTATVRRGCVDRQTLGSGLSGTAGVIALPAGTRIWLAAGVTDMRRGMHGLAALVQTVLLENVYCGHVFVFRVRKGDLIKVLGADRDGLCLFAKRLERGRFVWPQASFRLSPFDTGATVDVARRHRLETTTTDSRSVVRGLTIQRLITSTLGIHSSHGTRVRPVQEPSDPLPPVKSMAVDVASPRAGHRRPARLLPPELPRVVQVHAPGRCTCPDCGRQLSRLGENASEQLDYVHGYFQVIRHVGPKLSCGTCARIVQAPAPSRPIERGLPTAALLAQVVAAKYADHVPLYRQEGIYPRSGVELPRAMLASWVAEAAALVDPLVTALQRYVMRATKLHADDTPVPVLSPGRGRTRTGRLWAYVREDRPCGSTDPPAVVYRYSPDRKAERPREHLKSFTGILQADAYSGFTPLYGHGRIVEAACWAHSRRKYYDVYVADGSPMAAEALERIGEIYAIEREIRGRSPSERQAVRQARSAPVLEDLRARPAQLSLCRLGCGWGHRGTAVQPGRHVPLERDRSAPVPSPCSGVHRNASH